MPVKPRRTYPQLDAETLALLRARLDHHGGSRSALAREIGVGRTAVSQALDLRYPAGTDVLRSKILEALAGRLVCPHLETEIAPSHCKDLRERPLSAACGSRDDVKHWQACQLCQFNPHRQKEAG